MSFESVLCQVAKDYFSLKGPISEYELRRIHEPLMKRIEDENREKIERIRLRDGKFQELDEAVILFPEVGERYNNHPSVVKRKISSKRKRNGQIEISYQIKDGVKIIRLNFNPDIIPRVVENPAYNGEVLHWAHIPGLDRDCVENRSEYGVLFAALADGFCTFSPKINGRVLDKRQIKITIRDMEVMGSIVGMRFPLSFLQNEDMTRFLKHTGYDYLDKYFPRGD